MPIHISVKLKQFNSTFFTRLEYANYVFQAINVLKYINADVAYVIL